MSLATRRPLALALLLAVAVPEPSRADELSVDVPATAAVTGASLAALAALQLAGASLTPSTCRWCDPPALDENVRLHLRWNDTQLAGTISDLVLVGVPVALVATDYFAVAGGDWRRFGEDTLVVAEAISVSAVLTNVLKYATARRRPAAWASGVRSTFSDDNSFVSGHASATFAGAAAAGTVAMLRGYPGWPFIYAAGFAGATAVSYLRIAADRHWLTDVAAGAALGTAVGLAMPLLLHRRRDEPADSRSATIVITPMPLGVAGVF